MDYLIDTDVLSESSNPRPDPRVMGWLDSHDHELHLSVVSLGELVKGIELLPEGKRRKQIEAWFGRLERWADTRLLWLSPDILREWGCLCARHERKGRRLPVLDSLIAATALVHGLTLATRNTDDFPPEVPVVNPWLE